MKDGINISTELATTGLPKSAIEIELEKLSAKVANLTTQVESLNAIRAVAKEDEEEEEKEPVKGPGKENEHAHADRAPCDRSRWVDKQYVDEMIMGAERKRAEKEGQKNEKVSLTLEPSASYEAYYKGKLLKDFSFEKKRKLVLHDTVEQEAEALAQSHEKMLKALSQVEPDGMDYHMIKEMVKYIDILHSVRCSAERVASILTKD